MLFLINLFVLYITWLSAPLTLRMTDEYELEGRPKLWCRTLRYYPGIYKKPTQTSQENQSPEQYLNPRPLEYEAETHTRRSRRFARCGT